MQYLILDPVLWLTLSIILLAINLIKIKSYRFSISIFLFQALIIIASTPVFANLLTSFQEATVQINTGAKNNACFSQSSAVTLVVLGGGIDYNNNDFSLNKLHTKSFRRTVSTAELYKQNSESINRIIVSGGYGTKYKEADVMSYMLNQMGISKDIVIIENQSHNTYENAFNVSKIISREKLDNIILITSALHMKRATYAFASVDIDVCQYPVDSILIENSTLIPQINALYKTKLVVREILGYLIYRLRY